MSKKRKVTPIKDMPGYLKSLKEKGEYGDGRVFDMGQIEPERRSYKWLAYAALICFCVSGTIAYDVTKTKEHTITLEHSNPTQMISKIESDGGEIIAVKQNDDLTYEVKVATKKSRRSFLEWIRRNK